VIERVGPYRILRKLGEGGMGVVYAARDERLGRDVAIKLVSDALADEQSLKRFRREARLAASVGHPNICQLHEIGDEDGRPYIVMELLVGESLADRVRRGALPVPEAAEIELGVLAALEALHRQGVVHRDLKPANVFLTAHGVKLLDFGLARPETTELGRTQTELTQAGTVLGTPHYMAPEQIQGGRADARSDLFAAGAILFEMLAGRRAFDGRTLMEVLHATLHEQPPMLTGSAAVARLDTIVRRALCKRSDDRFATAAEMARELEAAQALDDSGAPAVARALTRLIVLPFRVLRPDPDTDFLAVSLPDAITTALSGVESVVMRSSVTAARFAGETPDLGRIAAEAQVDAALTGTLLRAGEQLRVSTQLVEVPGGAVLWSQATQATMGDIFELQDALVQRIVEKLALPLTAREQRALRRDVPGTAKAFEYFLRANPLSLQSDNWTLARQLYEQCLAEDPAYAPAWARLGRIYRLLAKYGPSEVEENRARAETAFRRALDLNPELALAHSLYAQLEVEAGRPKDAMVRLVSLAATRSHDAELLAGLCHALRYCGLLEASVAAHERARQIDPSVRTSVGYTYLAMGDYEKAVALEQLEGDIMLGYALTMQGRDREALAHYEALTTRLGGTLGLVASAMAGALRGDRDIVTRSIADFDRSGFRDPEGYYYVARLLARAGDVEGGLRFLRRTVDGGFYVLLLLVRDPWMLPLRPTPAFTEILALAEARHREAADAFIAAGGETLLAMSRTR
jgi:TolB-like protein